MTRFVPADINQLRDAVGEALMAEEPMEVLAGGSKRGLGRPVQTAHALDLSALSGIRDYAPSELVLTAGAATPLAEVEHALDEAGQLLAFEPPDWRGLLGAEDVGPTLTILKESGRKAHVIGRVLADGKRNVHLKQFGLVGHGKHFERA